jgi:hypothetical protein
MPKFRLPALPTYDCDSPVEIADLWEVVAVLSNSKKASLNDLRAIIRRQAESDPDSDAEEDIEEESRFDFATDEIRYRIAACGLNNYPFCFAQNSERVIELKVAIAPERSLLYLFLLLTTRLNMNTCRIFNQVDGPLLFEEVCEVALKKIWSDRVCSHRFGTSSGQGNFPNKLESFFNNLREFTLRTDRIIPNHGGDDGLDLAVWNSFTWEGANPIQTPRGKLILLAQCKTGTSWDKADLQRLQPINFFENWMQHTPLGQTARVFMASSRIDMREWEDHHRYGGLFFDRCRIVDYAAGHLPNDVFQKLQSWTEGAVVSQDLGIR